MRVEHETIRSYFENLIMEKLQSYAQNNGFEDLREKTVVANESYDGKTKKDIKVILKFLSAENTNGIIDLPIQVLVEVNTELQDIVFNILQDIAYEKHQKIETVYISENDIDYAFKQFYKTPTTLTTFQNGGVYKTSTMTMDMRIVAFETFATSNDMSLSFKYKVNASDNSATEYTNSSTEMKNFKATIINLVYHLEHRFDPVNIKNVKLQKNKYNSYNNVMTLSYILDKSNTIQENLWDKADGLIDIEITYKSNSVFTNAKTYKCAIQTYTENLLVTDVTKVTINFVSTGA